MPIFNGGAGPITFINPGEPSDGLQTIYVFDHDVAPVGLTIPYGAVPKDGNSSVFDVSEEGLLTHGGNAYFAIDGYGSVPSKQIFWYGSHNSEYMACNLSVVVYQ